MWDEYVDAVNEDCMGHCEAVLWGSELRLHCARAEGGARAEPEADGGGACGGPSIDEEEAHGGPEAEGARSGPGGDGKTHGEPVAGGGWGAGRMRS